MKIECFGVLPELGVNTRTALMPGTSLIFGYSLIVLSDVLRTGDQIDRVVNSSQIGGGAIPKPDRTLPCRSKWSFERVPGVHFHLFG